MVRGPAGSLRHVTEICLCVGARTHFGRQIPGAFSGQSVDIEDLTGVNEAFEGYKQ